MAQHPAQTLAIGRTAMANDRTFLAYIRTAIGLLGGGIGLIALVKHPVLEAVGWLCIALSAVVLLYGIRRFLQIRSMMIELLKRQRKE